MGPLLVELLRLSRNIALHMSLPYRGSRLDSARTRHFTNLSDRCLRNDTMILLRRRLRIQQFGVNVGACCLRLRRFYSKRFHRLNFHPFAARSVV